MPLSFMGVDSPEEFRCRIYGAQDTDEDERQRRAFLDTLATDGVLDCPAYDGWIRTLQGVGWVPDVPEFEPAPGGGRYARWRLTARGHAAWREQGGGPGR